MPFLSKENILGRSAQKVLDAGRLDVRKSDSHDSVNLRITMRLTSARSYLHFFASFLQYID